MIRKISVSDAKEIHALINEEARRKKVIHRSLNEIYENVRDYMVFEDKGGIKAVAALHVLWEDLAEIKSLVVGKKYRKKGIGSALVRACLKEAKKLGVKKVFVLTYAPGFFGKTGFKEQDKNTLPQKIWGDCLRCHKFPECDEVAMIVELD